MRFAEMHIVLDDSFRSRSKKMKCNDKCMGGFVIWEVFVLEKFELICIKNSFPRGKMDLSQ